MMFYRLHLYNMVSYVINNGTGRTRMQQRVSFVSTSCSRMTICDVNVEIDILDVQNIISFFANHSTPELVKCEQ